MAKLQCLLAQLSPVMTTTQWQCTICGLSYDGEKCCPQCRKRIYSRETRI
ncbi:zinc-ribbon domain-containing protein [Enterobacter hormaechei subsp. xiangfangensis]|nr:zinc-ribbon domain-containing protein [Enterobacter hormaechei]MCC9357716.1 zinc-ribbon domain-containing protein [Enterobacter hormaechei subsp. xiangfangensis]MCO5983703.1 zinc-ribbon domain-containing protein [Enterobacter hormaechei]MCU2365840.1 zinc-ribbon domain-containing protein [Enterobacter hormaechei subsp. xiangfangensis]MCU2486969.1 zinc-ribbon domain-containing protein [Enterobacter hormaechei subsp. xiangfangensis]MCU2532220.1 zinc-ribbon domain-containing protein [Enterobact